VEVAPNTEIRLPGVGYGIVNEQRLPAAGSTERTQVNGLHGFVTKNNTLWGAGGDPDPRRPRRQHGRALLAKLPTVDSRKSRFARPFLLFLSLFTECVEGEFCELRHNGVLRSSHMYGVWRTLPNGRSSRNRVPPYKEPGLPIWARQADQPSGQALKSWSRSQQTSAFSVVTFPILSFTTAMVMCFAAHSALGY